MEICKEVKEVLQSFGMMNDGMIDAADSGTDEEVNRLLEELEDLL